MLLTLRGTPTCYFGDELGMENVDVPVDRLRDTAGFSIDEARQFSRDRQWTPMRWDDGPNAGFCPPTVEPWLPIGADSNVVNVAFEAGDPRSMLSLFRALSRLRSQEPALQVGDYASLDTGAADVFAFERRLGDERLLIALNCSDSPATADLGSSAVRGEILLSTELDRYGTESLVAVRLRPTEGVVVRPGHDRSA